jgi:hypothetical protein
MMGSHLENLIISIVNEFKIRDLFDTSIFIRNLVGLGNEFILIRKGQEVVKNYMKFKQCMIYFLEHSTDSLISISEEKILEAKQKSLNEKEDPRVFKRSPKNLGVVGMVLRENKIFTSNYFIEAMLYDEDMCKNSVITNATKP